MAKLLWGEWNTWIARSVRLQRMVRPQAAPDGQHALFEEAFGQ